MGAYIDVSRTLRKPNVPVYLTSASSTRGGYYTKESTRDGTPYPTNASTQTSRSLALTPIQVHGISRQKPVRLWNGLKRRTICFVCPLSENHFWSITSPTPRRFSLPSITQTLWQRSLNH